MSRKKVIFLLQFYHSILIPKFPSHRSYQTFWQPIVPKNHANCQCQSQNANVAKRRSWICGLRLRVATLLRILHNRSPSWSLTSPLPFCIFLPEEGNSNFDWQNISYSNSNCCCYNLIMLLLCSSTYPSFLYFSS